MATQSKKPGDNPVDLELPALAEQVRLVAKAVADMRGVLALLTENPAHFFPGEAHDEMTKAWEEASPTFETVINAIIRKGPVQDETGRTITITEEVLEGNQLLGHVGAAKLSLLRRWKERLYHFWNTLPTPDVEKTPAITAGLEYLELATNVASSIPGAGPIKELLGLYKQQLKFRLVTGRE
jgi:hypothetical protein